MGCNHKQLRRALEAARKDKNPQRFWGDLKDAIETKQLLPTDFKVRQLFEEFVEGGRELADSFNPDHGGGYNIVALETAGAVSTSDFSNITGQIVYSVIKEKFESPELIGEQLCTVTPTQFNGEKIAGIGGIGDEASSIAEGESYPLAGVSEEYIETPVTTKRGFIVPITKEAIFFDRTGIVLQRCGEVGEWLAVNKEKRILDAVFGVTNSYKYNGTAQNTYNDGTPWDNTQASNALVDWTDIEAAELLFDAMTDPVTGEPIMVTPDTMIVPSALKHTARRVISATEVRTHVGGYATSGNLTDMASGNPVSQYKILSTAYVKARTSSASTWFIGQPKRAFLYMQNWPVTVVSAPANSEAEFTQDVVSRFKVSERGVPAVMEPRRMVKCTA